MISELRRRMAEKGLDSLILCDPDSIFYFTDCNIQPGERMYVLLLTQDTVRLILPEMFTDEAKSAKPEVERVLFKDTEDYIAYVVSALKNGSTVGVDKYLVAKFLLPLMERLPNAKFTDGSSVVDFMRMHKRPEECEKMRISSRLNDRIIGDFVKFLALPTSIGISEKDGAKKLIEIAEESGAEAISFEPIVSFGSGTAQPHHEPAGDVFLQPNMPVILDIGFVKDGYCSDMTRSFYRTEDAMLIPGIGAVGSDGEFKAFGAYHGCDSADGLKKFYEIYDVVKRANLAGIAKVAPGVPLSEVDAAARTLIAKAGYGEYFTHRLGHGIGIAVHEFPDVSSASDAVCAEGMIFSIEPGIYHMESGIGIRIEDLVLVTKDGCEVLNRYPK